jgi:fibronectin-binding autotransporter adhesin
MSLFSRLFGFATGNRGQRTSRKNASVRKSRRLNSHRLALEPLEQRQLLAVLCWDPGHTGTEYGGGSGDWMGQNNWWDSTNGRPATWNNENGGEEARFQGTTSTVSVSGSVVAQNVMIFNTNVSVLDGTGNGTGNLTLTQAGTAMTTTASQSTTITITCNCQLTVGSSQPQSWLVGASTTLSTSGSVVLSNDLGVGGSGSTTISGAISGSGSLTKLGTSTLVLTGNNEYYAGSITVSGGVLNIQHSSALGSDAAGTTVASGAALQLQGGISVGAEALTLYGTGISNGGALQNYSGNNTYGGLISLGDTSQINSISGLLTLSNQGTITGSGSGLTVCGNGSTSIASIIGTNGGTLTKEGSGTLTLSGTNLYSGGTNLSAGTLLVTNNSALGSGTLHLQGGTLSGSATLANAIEAVNATTSTISLASGSLTLNGDISGSGTINCLNGSGGSLRLGGNNGPHDGQSGFTGTFYINEASSSQTTSVLLTTVTAGSKDAAWVINNKGGLRSALSAAGTIELGSVSGTSVGPTTSGILGSAWNYTGPVIFKIGNLGRDDMFQGRIYQATALTSVEKVGAGTFTVTARDAWCPYGGGTTITAGTFQIGDGGYFWSYDMLGGGQSPAGGGTGIMRGDVYVCGGATLAFNFCWSSDQTDDGYNGGGSLNYIGAITGAGGVTKLGVGTLILSSASNSYSGDTKISNGTLVVGNANALSGSTLDYNSYGGSLSFGSLTAATFGGLKGNQNLALTNAGSNAVALTVGSNGINTTYSGILSGGGSLTKTGAGVLTLSGTNNYNGNTAIQNGTVVVAVDNALPVTTTLTLGSGSNSGMLQLGDGTTAHNQTLAGLLVSGSGANNRVVGGGTTNATLTLNISSTNSFGGKLGGGNPNQNNLVVEKTGAGTLTLSGTNTYSGGTYLSAGTLLVTNNSALGSGTLHLQGGTLSGSATLANAIEAVNGTTSVISLASGTLVLNGNISGSGTINCLNGSGGNLQLGGNNGPHDGLDGFKGIFSINEVSSSQTTTVSFTTATAGSKNAAWTINNNGNLRSALPTGGTIELGSVSGSSVGPTTSGKLGSGWNYTGPVTFRIGDLGRDDMFQGRVVQGTAITSVEKVGAGTFTVTARDAWCPYDGGTTITAGTFQIGDGGYFWSYDMLGGGQSPAGGGTGIMRGDVSVCSGGTLAFNFRYSTDQTDDGYNGGGSLNYIGTITGAGGVSKLGVGTLILSSASNSYSGDTKISNGTLVVGNANALSGSTLDYNSYGGSLSFGSLTAATFGGLKGSQNLALTNAGSSSVALTVGGNGVNNTYSGVLSGSGSLTKTGTGTLTLSNVNSYSGNTAIQNGTVVVAVDNALPATTVTLGSGSNSGMLQLGDGTTAHNQTLTGLLTSGSGTNRVVGGGTTNATLTLNISSANSFGGVLGGGGTNQDNLVLVKTGASKLTLTGANTYTGGTTISGGTVQLDNGGSLGDFDVSMSNGSSLVFNHSDNVVFNRNISGSGSLTQQGAGILTLGGTVNCSDVTTVSGGNLCVTGTIGSVVVDSGATLSGNGHTGVTHVSGYLSPGANGGSDIGTLHTGNLYLCAGSTYQVQLDSTSDAVDVQGAVHIDNNATLSLSGQYVDAVLTLIFNDSDEEIDGWFHDRAEDATFQFGSGTYRVTYRSGGNDMALIPVV